MKKEKDLETREALLIGKGGMWGSQEEGQFKLGSEDLSRFSVAGQQTQVEECAMCVSKQVGARQYRASNARRKDWDQVGGLLSSGRK